MFKVGDIVKVTHKTSYSSRKYDGKIGKIIEYYYSTYGQSYIGTLEINNVPGTPRFYSDEMSLITRRKLRRKHV